MQRAMRFPGERGKFGSSCREPARSFNAEYSTTDRGRRRLNLVRGRRSFATWRENLEATSNIISDRADRRQFSFSRQPPSRGWPPCARRSLYRQKLDSFDGQQRELKDGAAGLVRAHQQPSVRLHDRTEITAPAPSRQASSCSRTRIGARELRVAVSGLNRALSSSRPSRI